MSRHARQRSKTVRQARRAFQRLRRQARPLTDGEMHVVRHLLTPVRLQRHFSPDRDDYLQPNRYAWWYPYGPVGRHCGRSADLARRAERWIDQLPSMLVYHSECWMCDCQNYTRGFVPILDHHWPSGGTLHVDFDETAADYRAVRREVGLFAHNPHVVLSPALARIQAIILG